MASAGVKIVVASVLVICMLHAYIAAMTKNRTANLLGALALALSDAQRRETEAQADLGAAGPAALVTIGVDPGGSVQTLAGVLGLSHSATVRLVDRLTAAGLVERHAGADSRTLALYLTGLGGERRRQILDGRTRILSDALAPLSDGEQSALTALLEKLLSGLTQGRHHADHICRLCDEDCCPGETCPVEGAVGEH